MKKILIVEDVEFNLDLLVQLLEDDYELVTAVDGAEALARTAEERPDLILMDVRMPIMDGLYATRQIKQRWPQVKVIVDIFTQVGESLGI